MRHSAQTTPLLFNPLSLSYDFIEASAESYTKFSQSFEEETSQCPVTPSSSLHEDNNVVGPVNLTIFPHLPPFEDLQDFDNFILQVYRYWSAGGVVAVICMQLLHLIGLLFTWVLSWVLLIAIDWNIVLSKCSGLDISICTASDILTQPSSFSQISWFRLFWILQAWSYLGLLGFVILLTIYVCWRNCWEALAVRHFIHITLDLPTDDSIRFISWPEFVDMLIAATNPNANLSFSDVTGSIMRYDNIFIALVNKNILTKYLSSVIPIRLFYTTFTIWMIRFVICTHLFDSKRHLNKAFVTNSHILQRRFRWLGIFSLMFLIPFLIGAFFFALFRNVAEFRLDFVRPFSRCLNLYGYWTFMDYQELPHVYSMRVIEAESQIEDYLRLRTTHRDILEAFLRLTQYILTSLLGVLALIALIDDGPLLHIQLGGRHLLWYSIIFGASLTLLKFLTDTNQQRIDAPIFDMFSGSIILTETAHRVFEVLHYAPLHWKQLIGDLTFNGSTTFKNNNVHNNNNDRYYTTDDKNTLLLDPHAHSPTLVHTSSFFARPQHRRLQYELGYQCFSFRLQQLLEDILGILLTPYILLFVMPETASDICRFIGHTTYYNPHIGDVCLYSQFDQALKQSLLNIMPTHLTNSNNQRYSSDYYCSKYKVETSAIRFELEHWISSPQQNHPAKNNNSTSVIATLLKSIIEYQKDQLKTTWDKNISKPLVTSSLTPDYLLLPLDDPNMRRHPKLIHSFIHWYYQFSKSV